jgi:hypothetical protein
MPLVTAPTPATIFLPTARPPATTTDALPVLIAVCVLLNVVSVLLTLSTPNAPISADPILILAIELLSPAVPILTVLVFPAIVAAEAILIVTGEVLPPRLALVPLWVNVPLTVRSSNPLTSGSSITALVPRLATLDDHAPLVKIVGVTH